MNGRQFVLAIVIQGLIAITTIVCVTLLSALGDLDAQSVVGILGAALGIAGGVGGATAAAAAARPSAGTTHVPNPPTKLDAKE